MITLIPAERHFATLNQNEIKKLEKREKQTLQEQLLVVDQSWTLNQENEDFQP
jgi:hypothetical protein